MPLITQRHAAIWPAVTASALWLALTVAVWAGATAGPDTRISDQIPDFPFATVLTYAGDPLVILLFVVTLTGVLARWREWEAVRLVAGTFAAVAFTRWAFLWYLARPRPEGGLMEAFGWSYPSGHTAYAATAAMLMFVLIESRRSATLLLMAWPAVVGVTRVAVGVHWPSDVLGGLLLAIAAVSLVCISHPVRLTAQGDQAKTVRRQLHSLHRWGSPVKIRR